MSKEHLPNQGGGATWQEHKIGKDLESWINKLSGLRIQNWIDPRPYFIEASGNCETVCSELVPDKQKVDQLLSEFGGLNRHSLQNLGPEGYLLIELTETDYYLLKPLKSESEYQGRKFAGKLVELTFSHESDQSTQRSLYAVFLLSEIPIDPLDPNTEYETQFLADGMTLLEESVNTPEVTAGTAANQASTTLHYRYFKAGTPAPSSPYLKEAPPLSRTIETPTYLFDIQTHDSTTKASFYSTARPSSEQTPFPSKFVSLTSSRPCRAETSDAGVVNSQATQLLELLTETDVRVLVDHARGRYAVRQSDGTGGAALHHGTLVYCGQLAPDLSRVCSWVDSFIPQFYKPSVWSFQLSLDGLGHLVSADPEIAEPVQTPKESQARTIWQGLFRNGRIISGEMETSNWRYTGGFDEAGLPHGDGKVMFNNMDVYEGQMKHSRLEGFGKYTFFGGMKSYTGLFQLDKFHGKGCMKFHDGSIFLGDFDNGRPTNGTLKVSLSQFDIKQELWRTYTHRASDLNPLISRQSKFARISTVAIAKTKSKLATRFTQGLKQTNSWWSIFLGNVEPQQQPEVSITVPSAMNSTFTFESKEQPNYLYEYEGEFNEDFKAYGIH